MEERFFDLQGERCPMLMQHFIMILEDSPPGSTTIIVFNAPRLADRLPRYLYLYSCRLLELRRISQSAWRASIHKLHS